MLSFSCEELRDFLMQPYRGMALNPFEAIPPQQHLMQRK